MEDNDAQSQLKKRARRRLVGAVAFASVVAVVLPMVMDHEPRQSVQEVEIRIPGQDEKPLAPKFAVTPVEKPVPKTPEPAAEGKPSVVTEAAVPAAKPTARVLEVAKDKPVEKTPEKSAEKSPEKPQQKPAEKPAAKPEKAAEKPVEKPVAKESTADAKRAAAILAGAGAASEAAPAPAKTGEIVVLVGALAHGGNRRNLKAKLAEKNIKTYSEPLPTPGGTKTRVRAGPFPSREAAEKALEKMKQVGVSGVISGK